MTQNVGPIEEKHPFFVRLMWVALLVMMVGLILGIYFERHLSNTNDRIDRNNKAIALSNARQQEDSWQRCILSRKARFIAINNYRAEEKLYQYFGVLAKNSIVASKIIAKDPKQTAEARQAARQRITDGTAFLDHLPAIVIPKPVKPCGEEPHPGLLPLKKVTPSQKGSS